MGRLRGGQGCPFLLGQHLGDQVVYDLVSYFHDTPMGYSFFQAISHGSNELRNIVAVYYRNAIYPPTHTKQGRPGLRAPQFPKETPYTRGGYLPCCITILLNCLQINYPRKS